jgi:hypothetical protein
MLIPRIQEGEIIHKRYHALTLSTFSLEIHLLSDFQLSRVGRKQLEYLVSYIYSSSCEVSIALVALKSIPALPTNFVGSQFTVTCFESWEMQGRWSLLQLMESDISNFDIQR